MQPASWLDLTDLSEDLTTYSVLSCGWTSKKKNCLGQEHMKFLINKERITPVSTTEREGDIPKKPAMIEQS